MKLSPPRVIFVALLTGPSCALASAAVDAGAGTPLFSFSAFGTLGEVHSSQDMADFTDSVFQPNGAGYTHSWSATVDSLIGAQLTANILPTLSAVVQVIVEQNYDGTFRPHVEWANIKYQFTPDMSVRVGRSVLPTFLFSDTRNVGYTYPWVRPPVEVYSQLPLTECDGVDFSARIHSGNLSNTLQGNVGQSSVQQPQDKGTAYTRDAFGVSDTTEYEFFTLRLSYWHTHLIIAGVDPFLDTFRLFGLPGIVIANEYESDYKVVATEVIGASYDPGHWFVMSEWAHTKFNSFLGDRRGWYVSGGYRAGQFTPYATYAEASANSNSDPGLTLSALPSALVGFAAGLNVGLNALLQQSIPEQKTLTAGARWDFMKNVDLKLQIDHTRAGAESFGTLVNVQPGLRPGSTVNLFSATLNFVY
jgi:hypothetical protein